VKIANDRSRRRRGCNRTYKAVELTVPFGRLYIQSIVIIIWGSPSPAHHPSVVRDRRDHAPWYVTKGHPSPPGHDRQATAGS
jgi:hypothetical protein